ncbi:SpoIIE family protein phosphatase [Streptomyces sp. NPDC058864]
MTAIASGLLTVLISAVFALLIWSGDNLRETGLAERQSHAALAQSRRVGSLIVDVDSNQRGFILTKQSQFLERWKVAQSRFPAQAENLVRSSRIPTERDLALQISRAGQSFIDEYSNPLVDRAQHGDPQVRSQAATLDGRRRIDAFRSLLRKYVAVEQSDVVASESAADASAGRAKAVAAAGTVCATLVIAGYAAYVTRVVVQPIRRAAVVATRLASGELSARMPTTGRHEIGLLEAAFNTMANSLERTLGQAQQAYRRVKLLYEASVAVGTTLDVMRTAQELVDVAVPGFADFASVDLVVSVLQSAEPGAADDSPPLQRVALGGIHNRVPLDPVGTVVQCHVPSEKGPGFLREAVLADDLRAYTLASDGPQEGSKLLWSGINSMISVPLVTQGALLGMVTFWRSRTAPFAAPDLSDAEGLAVKAAVAIDNARRYAHERESALTLQHALLPQHPPDHSAVDVAYRYLPTGTRAGVGGDWFDVIPLSGTRVALVVGDIVGHGIQASATMGRLRTAVRTLADVDLPPDELLTHLDDLVAHLGDGDTSEIRGATCLYAIYDPISRHCTLASAGHPLPFLIYKDGAVESVAGEIGPPVGVADLPFENIELDLEEGSTLALYSDGLVVHSGRKDISEGLTLLRQALATAAGSLEATCSNVMETLLTGPPEDDVVLLLARASALPCEQVASWAIPSEPEHVAHARALATEQLEAWQLEESSFITELVVSELVTNAIRYGTPPIQLRLIRDTTLICEVSDSSNTAPHLRRARTFDEGGRGLLLVAQLTQRWGTRHARGGKTIWCEQPLPSKPEPSRSSEPESAVPSGLPAEYSPDRDGGERRGIARR